MIPHFLQPFMMTERESDIMTLLNAPHQWCIGSLLLLAGTPKIHFASSRPHAWHILNHEQGKLYLKNKRLYLVRKETLEVYDT